MNGNEVEMGFFIFKRVFGVLELVFDWINGVFEYCWVLI